MEFQRGDRVVAIEETYNKDESRRVAAGTTGRVGRVFTNTVEVVWDSGKAQFKYWSDWDTVYGVSTFTVPKEAVTAWEGRELGQTPEGGIAVDDPRIAWLWEDLTEAAIQTGNRMEWRAISDLLGVPGEEREFKVSKKVNGLTINTRISAKSRPEAEQKFDQILAAHTN